MNRLAIHLNNNAVASLKQGNVIKAFQLLSKASNVTMNGVSSHKHVDSSNSAYRFHWEDCSMAFSDKAPASDDSTKSVSWEGSVPFLFLRGLRVSIPDTEEIDTLCPCGFAWVIWYNLGLCCSLLGTRLGDRGYSLLRKAFDLYLKVQRRIDNEPPSMHWNVLQMAVMNNQACIYHDFCMREARSECLDKLAMALVTTPGMKGEDRKRFFLNLQILGGGHIAPAA
jgi:hypothetical protein